MRRENSFSCKHREREKKGKRKEKKRKKEKERKKKHDFPPEARFLLEKSKRPTCCRDKQWHYGNPRIDVFLLVENSKSIRRSLDPPLSLSLFLFRETKFLEFLNWTSLSIFLPWKIEVAVHAGRFKNFDKIREIIVFLWISNSRDDLTSRRVTREIFEKFLRVSDVIFFSTLLPLSL